MTAIPASLPDPDEEFYTTHETGLLLRVMRRVEETARRLQRERGPSTATVAMDSTGVRQ